MVFSCPPSVSDGAIVALENRECLMRRLIITATAAVSTIALTQIASAADRRRPAPPVVAAPVPYADWSGVYVGIEGGYGWGKQTPNGVSPGGCFNCLEIEIISLDRVIERPFFPDVALP